MPQPNRANVPSDPFGDTDALGKLLRPSTPPSANELEQGELQASDSASSHKQSPKIGAVGQKLSKAQSPARKDELLIQDVVEEETEEAERRELMRASFYLYPEQLEKLDDLAVAYRKKTGRRVNRQHILRWLINRSDLDLIVEGAD
jgi:hypothetical protein